MMASTEVRDRPASVETTTAPPAPKAWTTGTNPITQRRTVSPTVNGKVNGHGQTSQEQAKNGARANAQSNEKHAHDRLMFLLVNFIACDATISLKSGDRFTGVFSGASTHNGEGRYNFKMVRKLSSEQPDGTLAGDGEDHSMAFDINDTVDLVVAGVSFGSAQIKAANGSAFRTDTEISGHLDMRERVLQRWEPAPDDKTDLSLGGSGGLGHGSWDQFATNEKLYNVKSDYNEDLYTTVIDKSNPQYQQRMAEADRIAREIEGNSSRNTAQADSGLDEEDKYSGVRRDTPALGKSGPNAYIPPSKRGTSINPEGSLKPVPATSQGRSHSTSGQGGTEKADTAEAPAATGIKGTLAKTIKSLSPDLGSKSPNPGVETTENHIKDASNAFGVWAHSEKLRVQAQRTHQQAQKATTARQEKSVKLNDLKKFSQMFKLSSRVPEDLVPILAKSKEKQDEIIKKADQQAREKEVQTATGSTTPQKDSKTESGPPTQTATTPVNGADNTLRVGNRTRSQQQPQPAKSPNPQAQASRTPSQADQRSQPPSRVPSVATIPPPPAIAPTPPSVTPARSGVLSPPSASSMRFNAAAMEFKPNPAASNFTPGASSNDAGSKRPSVTSPALLPARQAAPPDFFGPEAKKIKFGQHEPVVIQAFLWEQTIKVDPAKASQFASNGGTPQGYRTAPVYDTPEANNEKTMDDFFSNTIQPSAHPIHPMQNGIMPHQHQLPLHLQNQGQPGHQQPFFRGQGQHHMDDQRMHFASNPSSMHPSPRMGQSPMMFNGQPQVPMAGYPFAMPPGGMSPAMAMRTLPGGGQYPGSPMGGQMMVPQPSNGPYQQPMQMYPSPVPGHAQPHFGGPGGYGGGPRGFPMTHQGSQQGNTPQPMYMMPGQMVMMPHAGPGPARGYNPQFGGQHPQNAYGMQHRNMSNGSYHSQHVTPRQQHASPHQQPASSVATSSPTVGGAEDSR